MRVLCEARLSMEEMQSYQEIRHVHTEAEEVGKPLTRGRTEG